MWEGARGNGMKWNGREGKREAEKCGILWETVQANPGGGKSGFRSSLEGMPKISSEKNGGNVSPECSALNRQCRGGARRCSATPVWCRGCQAVHHRATARAGTSSCAGVWSRIAFDAFLAHCLWHGARGSGSTEPLATARVSRYWAARGLCTRRICRTERRIICMRGRRCTRSSRDMVPLCYSSSSWSTPSKSCCSKNAAAPSASSNTSSWCTMSISQPNRSRSHATTCAGV